MGLRKPEVTGSIPVRSTPFASPLALRASVTTSEGSPSNGKPGRAAAAQVGRGDELFQSRHTFPLTAPGVGHRSPQRSALAVDPHDRSRHGARGAADAAGGGPMPSN